MGPEGTPSSQNSLSDYYERMHWLLPDKICDHLLSESLQVTDAKKGSYEWL